MAQQLEFISPDLKRPDSARLVQVKRWHQRTPSVGRWTGERWETAVGNPLYNVTAWKDLPPGIAEKAEEPCQPESRS